MVEKDPLKKISQSMLVEIEFLGWGIEIGKDK